MFLYFLIMIFEFEHQELKQNLGLWKKNKPLNSKFSCSFQLLTFTPLLFQEGTILLLITNLLSFFYSEPLSDGHWPVEVELGNSSSCLMFHYWPLLSTDWCSARNRGGCGREGGSLPGWGCSERHRCPESSGPGSQGCVCGEASHLGLSFSGNWRTKK